MSTLEAHGVTVMAHQASGHGVLVDRADLRIAPGRWMALVGPNGAGKSTLLRALADLPAPRLEVQGMVLLDGRPINTWPARQRAQRIGWLAQDDAPQADLTALDVALLGRLPHRGWWQGVSDADLDAAHAALKAVHMHALAGRPLAALSGGERRRVLLARLLAGSAAVLLMDEPLAHLDLRFHGDFADLMRRLCARGHAVVTVLHEASLALAADDLAVMQAGRLCHVGAVQDAMTHRALEAAFDHRVAVVPLSDAGTQAQSTALPHEAQRRHLTRPLLHWTVQPLARADQSTHHE